ncbi:Cryptochrome-1 [Gracilariopsis chorda]|uniref:Cryptochrome-1 n=1 Tax=Gracilariopsis chorda TaxID=448386 RepID=A0A2V3INA7_9FLOR|nr:Cryptochrome-1 [Gracilariopsis chorda]|eukprot:PXF43553.1 Cryptochrome-1 [Gracilariopsis chorda]
MSAFHATVPSAKWFRKPSVVWYRGNDLRVEDHPALLAAAQRGGPVVPLFIWDSSDGFGAAMGATKQWWLRESLTHLQHDLRRLGVQLYTRKGRSTEELRAFLHETGADAVFWNRCYEPDLLKRDEELREELAQEGLTAVSFKAELLVEPWELTNSKTSPRFETFHTYMCAWMTVAPPPQPFPCPSRLQPISKIVPSTGIDLLGFVIPDDVANKLGKVWTPGSAHAKRQLDRFLKEIFPAFGDSRCRRHFEGTSRLSPHIRFGELSPRRMYHATRLRVLRDQQNLQKASIGQSAEPNPYAVKHPALSDVKSLTGENNKFRKQDIHGLSAPCSSPVGGQNASLRDMSTIRRPQTRNNKADQASATPTGRRRGVLPQISRSGRAFLKNLCLRDFSYHVLYHFPDLNSQPLIPEFAKFPWAEDNGLFARWRAGATGYPIVDAAMRQLHQSGWVHNGMRFLLACFLTKYLLLPWSRGLEQFYDLLIDGDRSANALGWQWTTGSNTDAFPITALVNPVKQAHKHDPNGDYIRRWLPELARLPVEYIHEPWKAPFEVLDKCGVQLGNTYPKRIVLISDARARATKAMTTMKRLFAGNIVWRRYLKYDEEDLINEWPEQKPNAVRVDESNNPNGKGFLLPSLWALLQCEQPPSYISGSSTAIEPLISMDTTACLVDGALAIPLDDQPESIEQAFISTHEFVSTDPHLSSDGLLSPEVRDVDTPSVPHVPSDEQSHALFHGENIKSEDVQQLQDPMKYTAVGSESYKDEARIQNQVEDEFGSSLANQGEDKKRTPDKGQPSAPAENIVCDTVSAVPDQNRRITASPPASHGSQASQEQPARNQPVLGLEQYTTQASDPAALTPHSAAQRPFAISHSNALQSQSSIHARIRPNNKEPHEQQIQFQQSQIHAPFHIGDLRGHQSFSQVLLSSQQYHGTDAHIAKFQPSQHGSQHPMVPVHNVMDPTYAARFSTGRVHLNPMAGVPMPANPVMMGTVPTGMGSVPSGSEFGTSHLLNGGDTLNAQQAHAVRAHPFFGYRQYVPMVNAHPSSTGERPELVGPSAAHSQKFSVPAIFPVSYDIYGNGAFDPSVFGGSLSQPQFPSHVYAPQSQAVPIGVRHANGTSHPLLFPVGPRTELQQPQTSSVLSQEVTNAGAVAPNRHEPGAVGGSSSMLNGTTRKSVNQNRLAEFEETCATPSRIYSARCRKGGQPSTSKGPGSANGGYVTPSTNVDNTSGLNISQQSRPNTKPIPKQRQPPRSKRLRQSQGLSSRGKHDAKKGSKERSQRNGSESTHKAQAQSVGAATTPKSRQKILESVLTTEGHEYRGFARYLSQTYEFTGNTDRQTSRDYVRLCNLKDDYHKKCNSEKHKLKIYRIKHFFSKVLKLEVTGEWDRHNHGGVRGPYVYGIKLKQQANSKSK